MSMMLCSVFLIVTTITTVHERKTLPLLTIVRAATGRVQKLLVKQGSLLFSKFEFSIKPDLRYLSFS